MFLLLTAFCVHVANGHSWAEIVGGGSYRGAQGSTDLVKERYFCPKSSLEECQPPNSTNVVLTPANSRPCRTDFPTPVWGSGIPGQPMYIHWAGNGHTGNQSTGTCVSIYITKYALDPDFSMFRPLASCLPFSYGSDITDANVTIPAELTPGQYTIFWLWDFAPFWFSSCSDINLGFPSSTARPTVSVRPTPKSLRSATTYSETTTASGLSTFRLVYESRGCASLNQQFCPQTFGPQSYCKTWSVDRCGRSTCFGSVLDPKSCSVTTRAPAVTTVTPRASTSTSSSNRGLRDIYRDSGCSKMPTTTCANLFGTASYCKSWSLDGCGRSTCFGPDSMTRLTDC